MNTFIQNNFTAYLNCSPDLLSRLPVLSFQLYCAGSLSMLCISEYIFEKLPNIKRCLSSDKCCSSYKNIQEGVLLVSNDFINAGN